MQKFNGSPLGENVVVRVVDEYDGPLALAQGESRVRRSLRGVVVAVGPGAPLANGSARPMEVKRGDVVFFGAMTGMEANFAGDPVRVMRESDIVAAMEQR